MKIELHQITNCGFYQRGKPAAPLFGHLHTWHRDFHQWVGQRTSVNNTSTFDSEAGVPNVFCAGSTHTAAGLGLILWHGVPATEKGVAYIPKNATPGHVTASEAALPHNSIPGWPSYFWLLPQQNLAVTLQPTGKIQNRSTGLPECRDFLAGYLTRFSPFVHILQEADQANGIERQIAWRANHTSPSRTDLAGQFLTRPLLLPCALDQIRSKYADIRKLIHTVQISRALPVDRAKLTQLMHLIGFDQYAAPETDRLSFRWESDWQPTPAELDSAIAQHEQADTTHGRKERRGVRFKGDSQIYWLDGGPVRDDIALPDELERALHWSPAQMQQAWALAEATVQELVSNAS